MNEKQIGDLIRTRRQELKISQDYVASRCGVTKSTVSRWETGYIKKIKRGDIFMLSRILYLPAETILYGNKIDCILPSAIVLKQKSIKEKVNKITDLKKLAMVEKFIVNFIEDDK